MSGILIDGKSVSKRVLSELKADVAEFVSLGKPAPLLAVVLVGEDPASQVYVRSKTKRAKTAGMDVLDTILPADVSNSDLQNTLVELSRNPKVDGILLQLPLPSGLDEFAALLCITPEKDVDGLHPFSQGLLVRGADGFKPCTPYGSMILIEEACLLLKKPSDLSGMNAVVVGRSVLVANCTVSVCHSRTKDLKAHTSQADILIAAVGRPELITGDYVKPGAIVIDVGINRTEEGSLVGDCEFDSCAAVAGAITPVPGGVGPMTIAVLLQNTLYSARNREPRI
ncbi:UNVERIFIED_CONTAM: hypothetical protein GTU68_027371 [Idotea baltica]|nr:hypothetical protein [Idotea baltica]